MPLSLLGIALTGNWVKYSGLNCFSGHGGEVMDGGRSLGVMTLSECQEQCADLPACSAVTYHLLAANGSAAGNCYRRSSVELQNCENQPDYATFTRRTPAIGLQERINTAIANHASVLAIDGGEYHFGSTSLKIVGAEDLQILSPEPVKLWFSGVAGVNITSATDLSLGNWTIDYVEHSEHLENGNTGITFHLFNSTRVRVEDLTIHHTSAMAVTAFNGGGDHMFRRLKFDPIRTGPCPSRRPLEICHLVAKRDAVHFSDQRRGSTIVDSIIGFSEDDFFNIHTTLMVVLRCDSTSCFMVNPHLVGNPRNTVYGSNSVMEMVEAGDRMSFYSWLDADFITKRYGDDSSPYLVVRGTTRITDPSLLAEAATLPPELGTCKHNPVFCTNETVHWEASDLWQVEFETEVPKGVGRTAMVQIDSISNAGTVLSNNLFTNTTCNLGRYKSSDSIIEGNTFRHALIPNLELTWLPQFFEGPVRVVNVSIANNVIEGAGSTPIHCGPWCEHPSCVGPPKFGPWDEKNCAACPDCTAAPAGNTTWTAEIILRNNTFADGVAARFLV